MHSVLVVDDHDDSREAVARYLTRCGFAARSAPNGREALLSILTATPSVIVLDVMMPEMNGIELLQILRSYIRWTTLPVVLLTAYPNGPHIEAARQLGVKAVFPKSTYHLDDLVACIRKLCDDPNASCAG